MNQSGDSVWMKWSFTDWLIACKLHFIIFFSFHYNYEELWISRIMDLKCKNLTSALCVISYWLDKRHKEKDISCVRENFWHSWGSHENVIVFSFFFVELLCVHRLLTWHYLTVLPIIRREEYDAVFRRTIRSIKDHLLIQYSLDRLVKWGLNARCTCAAKCSHGFRSTECRRYDPCGKVYLGTGREFGEGLMFIVGYPLDTDMQYKIEAIGRL